MCFSPLLRVDERLIYSRSSAYFSLFELDKKKPYRGAYFLDYEKFMTKLERNKDVRDNILNNKYVSLIPCGRCKMCLLKYSRDWSIRTYLESLETEKDKTNYFLTLTYNDNFILKNKKDFACKETGEIFSVPELSKRDMQLFIKRLRKRFGDNIKYFICGEYGPKTKRPHYHLILLNMPLIPDLEFLTSSCGNVYFTSNIFNDLWQFGFHSLSECNLNTIFYTSHYCLKKSGQPKIKVYDIENNLFQGEFQLMSRSPGLANEYLKTQAYNINKLLVSTIKLNNISFDLKSIKYYNYLFDKYEIWRPDKAPIDTTRIELLYNNSFLSESESENFKQHIINTESKTYRDKI